MRSFILDTNILMAYLKADPLFSKVSEDNKLHEDDVFIMISSVTKGEILALQNKWGKPMGKNDLWIAATAFASNATLLTADRDFLHLNQAFIPVKFYDPSVPK